LRILEFKVVRFIPSFPAASAMTPSTLRRAPKMTIREILGDNETLWLYAREA
jgi:hypothetical protein